MNNDNINMEGDFVDPSIPQRPWYQSMPDETFPATTADFEAALPKPVDFTGKPIIVGTMGDDTQGDLKELFYNPETFRTQEFPDEVSKVAFYNPNTGVWISPEAVELHKKWREAAELEALRNPPHLRDKRRAEYPMSPKEAFIGENPIDETKSNNKPVKGLWEQMYETNKPQTVEKVFEDLQRIENEKGAPKLVLKTGRNGL